MSRRKIKVEENTDIEPIVKEETTLEKVIPIEEQEPIFMEPDEYAEYLKNQVKNLPEEQREEPIAQVTMYQMNKDLINGLKSMTNMEVNNALDKIADWFEGHTKDKYMLHFALLNHEKHYFTIFACNALKRPVRMTPWQSFRAELKDVLTNHYGDHDLRSIEVEMIDGKPSGAVEIWAMWDGEPTVAYLFPYEQGVVYY